MNHKNQNHHGDRRFPQKLGIATKGRWNVPYHSSSPRFPWKPILMSFALVFATGVMYLAQDYGDYFLGSLLGSPKTTYQAYDALGGCPTDSGEFVEWPMVNRTIFPLPTSVLEKKDTASIVQMYRQAVADGYFTTNISYKITPALWNKAIDIMAESTRGEDYLKVLALFEGKGSWHGALDIATHGDENVKALFPLENGRVVSSGYKSGYGENVVVCFDRVGSDGVPRRYTYGVGHLKSRSVEEGQLVKAGDMLGVTGRTGSANGIHQHIGIYADGYLDTSNPFRYVYEFFFPKSLEDMAVKYVPVDFLMLKGAMAYEVVENDELKQVVWESGVVGHLTKAQDHNAELAIQNGGANVLNIVPVFSQYRMTVLKSTVLVGETQTIVVEAVNSDGNVLAGYQEPSLLVAVSPVTARTNVDRMTFADGRLTVQAIGTEAGVHHLDLGNGGSRASSVSWTVERPTVFQLTAPQKVFEGNTAVQVAVFGADGEVVGSLDQAGVQYFPVVDGAPETLTFVQGRAEIVVPFVQEGIYEVTVQRIVGGEKVLGSVRIEVAKRETGNQESGIRNQELGISNQELVISNQESVEGSEVQPQTSLDDVESPDPSAPLSGTSPLERGESSFIVFPEKGVKFQVHKDSKGRTLVMVDDRDVSGEQYPFLFTDIKVPGATEVSVVACYDWGICPESGRFKLTKYDPNKGSFDYGPKFGGEVLYRRIEAVMNDATSTLDFAIVPMSYGGYLDVAPGSKYYESVQVLKQKKVALGNPDGTFGVDSQLNRASAITFFARAMGVDLAGVDVSKVSFKDLDSKKWYAPPIAWGATSMPVLLKGSDGYVRPDGSVQKVEMVVMGLRLLGIEYEVTEPWYNGPMAKAVELGFVKGDDAGTELTRGEVAEVLVRVLGKLGDRNQESVTRNQETGISNQELVTSNQESVEGSEVQPQASTETQTPLSGEATAKAGQAGHLPPLSGAGESFKTPVERSVAELTVVDKVVVIPAPVNVEAVFTIDGIRLTWEYETSGEFTVYRRQRGEGSFEPVANLIGKEWVDKQAEPGREYEYTVDAEQGGSRSDVSKVVVMRRD